MYIVCIYIYICYTVGGKYYATNILISLLLSSPSMLFEIYAQSGSKKSARNRLATCLQR